jgi:hypothetical protein
MAEKNRRRELVAEYKRNRPEAGVYRVMNTENGKVLVGSALNLASVRNKVEFARSTNSASGLGALSHRLLADARQFGLDAFTLEIVEVLEPRAEQTDAEIKADLATLEALWREKCDPTTLY